MNQAKTLDFGVGKAVCIEKCPNGLWEDVLEQ